MRSRVQIKSGNGLLEFFRTTAITLEESDLIELGKKYENEIKQIKDNRYRIGWYMRGSISYHDLMYKISNDDLELFNRIIKENIETTEKTRLPLL